MSKSKIGKRVMVYLVVFLLMLAFTNDKSNAQTKFVVFGGGGTGGTFYIIASGFASLAEKYIPGVKATSEISAGSVENIKWLARGKTTFAMLAAETAYHAYRKLREFKDTQDKTEDLRLVMYGYISTLHILVHDDSPIRSLADVKGKKLALESGPVAMAWWPFIANAYNIKVTDHSSVVLRDGEAMNALRDNNVDAAVIWTAVPTVSVTDLTFTKKIRFIEIQDKEAKMITKDRIYFSQGIMPANSYSGQKADIKTLVTPVTLGTNASVDPDLVYKFLDVLLTHNAELKRIHPKAAEFNKENAVGEEVYPYHEGAKKYYKERGMMK